MEPGSPRGLTHLSKCGILRDFIAEELNLAARDIIEEMERTMADYEAKTSELKQEIEEQRRQLEYLHPEGSSENTRKRPRSQMWEHFELIGPNRLQCLLCPQQLSYNNNTSSMMRHFKAKHDGILETDYDKKHDLDQALVNLVVKDSQPCSIVEDRGFRDFVKKLDPSYALPSKQALKKMVDDRYQEEKADAQAQLREAEAVSLTVDLWTSADTRLAVACHYVLENSKLATVLLGVLPFPQNHGPADVADAQRTLMAEWGLEGKVKCLVSDAQPSMVAAADDLALPHVECIAHALNGVVRRALDKTAGLKGLRRRAGEVVAFFRSSAAAKEKLRSKQQKLALPMTKLVREESSRWTSTFLMLQSLLDARRAVGSALTALGAKVEPLSCDESETSAACLQVLKPFYTATVEMSEQKRVLGSMGIPLVKMLLLATEEVAEESDNVTAELLGQNLSVGLRREFDDLEENPVLSLATLLDPRFKTIGFRCQEKAQQAVQTLTAECAALVRPAPDRAAERPAQQTSTAFNLWKSLDDQASMVRTHSNATADATLEVQRYMTDPPLERSQDPLVYMRRGEQLLLRLFLHDQLLVAARSGLQQQLNPGLQQLQLPLLPRDPPPEARRLLLVVGHRPLHHRQDVAGGDAELLGDDPSEDVGLGEALAVGGAEKHPEDLFSPHLWIFLTNFRGGLLLVTV